MSDPQTYAELQTQIIEWMVRDDLDTLAPKFISLAENRFSRVLRVSDMEDVASVTISSGTATLPTDFLSMRSIHLGTDPHVVLEQMPLARLRAYYSDTAGRPVHFAIQSRTQLVVGPSADASYTATLNYYAAIPALSDDDPDNWLLLAHPDLYLAASLFEGFTYTRDEGGMNLWGARTAGIIAEIDQDARRRTTGSPLVARASNAA